MPKNLSLIEFLLQIADNALIMGHRLSEWTGHGPILEQDIAITNMALDHIGQARALYQYAAQKINELPPAERQQLFASAVLQNKTTDYTEDDLAYLRDAWDYRNLLLVEIPNGNWADTIARSFFYDHYTYALFDFIQKKFSDEQLKAIAEKSLKEVTYHKRWSSEWVIRLGDGTEESHQKMQEAINEVWPFSGEIFMLSPCEQEIFVPFKSFDVQQARNNWDTEITAILNEAGLSHPDINAWMQSGGKEGRHTEHLGFLLSELQFMQRAYPGMEW